MLTTVSLRNNEKKQENKDAKRPRPSIAVNRKNKLVGEGMGKGRVSVSCAP
jgi:hypothetical protein